MTRLVDAEVVEIMAELNRYRQMITSDTILAICETQRVINMYFKMHNEIKNLPHISETEKKLIDLVTQTINQFIFDRAKQIKIDRENKQQETEILNILFEMEKHNVTI